MPNQINSIIRKSTRKSNDKLNILCADTHESYQSNLSKTNHNFYSFAHNSFKTWDSKYRPIPSNYTILDITKEVNQLPEYIDFDLVLSQNKFGQFQILSQLAANLHVPLISLEHTMITNDNLRRNAPLLKQMRGDVNVFISEFSKANWGWEKDEAIVALHGVDTEIFSPDNKVEKNNRILGVCNDWINRREICGYDIFRNATEGLPVRIVGNTPGLSKPASSVDDLVNEYRSSTIFINTAPLSPIPSVLLEALSCGVACVSLNVCMVPEVITHGVNGFLANDVNELRSYIELLLNNEELRTRLGAAARKTILEKFSLDKFVSRWNEIFEFAAVIRK